MTERLNAEEIIEHEVRKLSSACTTSVLKMERLMGAELAHEIYYHVIAGIVAAAATTVLHRRGKINIVNKRKLLEATQQDFIDARAKIQDAVATGITSAMIQFTGQPVDYYCQIKMVPPVINREEC